LTRKENFNVSQYIRKSDYPSIHPLVANAPFYKRESFGQFVAVEERAYFPNGIPALTQFIKAFIRYPEEAAKK
jgi:hypothetical protein